MRMSQGKDEEYFPLCLFAFSRLFLAQLMSMEGNENVPMNAVCTDTKSRTPSKASRLLSRSYPNSFHWPFCITEPIGRKYFSQ